MITIKDFMEAVEYRVSEGSEFMWSCWGKDAFTLDSWNGDIDGHTVSITFDTKTQIVYCASVYDYRQNRAYRLLHPDFEQAYRDEATSRSVNLNEATDEIQFVDLEVEEDFLEKSRAIVRGEDCSTNITIQLNLDKDLIFELAMIAHEKDITLNRLINSALKNAFNLEYVK